MVEKILNNTTPYGNIRASHEGSLHSSTLNENTDAMSYIRWFHLIVLVCIFRHMQWNLQGVIIFVCLCLTSLLNISGHIATVPACSSGTLTNVLPHRNAMPQIQAMTPHPVTVYRHRADLSLCYPLMWNVTLEYTATQFNVFGKTRLGNPSRPSTHISERSTNSGLVVVSRMVGRRYCTNWVLNPGPVVCESITLSARPQLLLCNKRSADIILLFHNKRY